MKNIIVTITAFLLLASAAFAQGSIEGTVTDANGKPVAGIKVTVFGADGKSVVSVTTGADGAYSFDEIAAGKYRVAAFAIDYQEPVIRAGVTVEDDDVATVDITMGAKRVIPTPPKPTPTPPPASPIGYVPEMTALIAELNGFSSLRHPKELLNISARFVTIGDAQKTEWLPYYYGALAVASYGAILSARRDSSVDENVDKGNALLNRAEALSKGNSEIYVVRALFAQQQILVDPMVRWDLYGVQVEDAMKTAKKLNPNNPRVYLMEGQSIFSAPEQFGGGKANAKPILEEAVRKFDAFKPESSLSPNWGRRQAVGMLKQVSQ